MREVTLEEAAQIIGGPIPLPQYLPAGFSLRRVYKGRTLVHLLFSDNAIAQEVENQYELLDLEDTVPLVIWVRKIKSGNFSRPLSFEPSMPSLIEAGYKVVQVGEFKGLFRSTTTISSLFLYHPGLTFSLKTPHRLTEEELIEVAASIPVVVQPYFRTARTVSLEEAEAALGATLPLPRYLPEGYELKRVIMLDDHPHVAYLLYSTGEIPGAIETIVELYRIWDSIGEGTSPAIIVRLAFPAGPWHKTEPEAAKTWWGAEELVDLELTKAITAGVSYHILNWKYPQPGGGSLFDVLLIAPEMLPAQEVIQLARSMLY